MCPSSLSMDGHEVSKHNKNQWGWSCSPSQRHLALQGLRTFGWEEKIRRGVKCKTFKSSRKSKRGLVLAGFSEMASLSFPLWKEMQINVSPMASCVFLCMDFGIAK